MLALAKMVATIRLSLDPQRHVPLVGLLDQAGHHDLGAVEWLDAGRRLRDPGMNSFAHYSFGAVFQWMMENLAASVPKQPLQEHKHCAVLDDKLTYVKASYDSIRAASPPRGKKKGQLTLDVTIPPTPPHRVHPAKAAAQITEGGQPLAQATA